MPEINIKSIYTCSSEDPNFPALNLLDKQNKKKWKCQNVGESSAYVIFQLDKPSMIHGIDIGNEHSGFIEVLVAKNGASQDNFKEILLTSSFMTPNESRNSTNPNRVRCFSKNALVEQVLNEKWEVIKIVCTQPFNRHVRYGLSFVKFYSPEDQEQEKSQTNTNRPPLKLGKFTLREDSPDSDNDSKKSSLFERWRQSRDNNNKPKVITPPITSISTASAIRAASSPAVVKKTITTEMVKKNVIARKRSVSSSDDENIPVVDRNRDELLYDKDDERNDDKFNKKLAKDEMEKQKWKNERSEKNKIDGSKKLESSTSKFKDFLTLSAENKTKVNSDKLEMSPTARENERKRPSSPISNNGSNSKKIKVIEKKHTYKPFHQLMQGVVLTISGIQNPERANLRQKATELGAKYKPDWDSDCTHLICAFKNTPKYNQVKGIGKIVKKSWVFDSYAKEKRIPWRRYALNSDDENLTESEDEILHIKQKPSSPELSIAEKSDLEPQVTESDAGILAQYDLEDEVTIVEEEQKHYDVYSGSDTEEEIEKIIAKKKETKIDSLKKESTNNVFDESTENECEDTSHAVENFFKNKFFYLSKDIHAVKLIKLKRIIKIYGGEVTDLVSKCNYFITENSTGTLSNFSGEQVKPLWIEECHDMECLLPQKRYLL